MLKSSNEFTASKKIIPFVPRKHTNARLANEVNGRIALLEQKIEVERAEMEYMSRTALEHYEYLSDDVVLVKKSQRLDRMLKYLYQLNTAVPFE